MINKSRKKGDIFCSQCSWIQPRNWIKSSELGDPKVKTHRCTCPTLCKNDKTPIQLTIIYADPFVENKYNDCKFFSPIGDKK